MENKKLAFYFDFMSPYSYLAFTRMPSLANKHSLDIEYIPVNLAKLKLAAGNTGPATREMPIKLKYALDDIRRWSAKYEIPFTLPGGGPLDSLLLNKGAIYADKNSCAERYIKKVWGYTFGKGLPMNNDLLKTVARDLDLNIIDMISFVGSDQADAIYQKSTNLASDLGVFGVPTMRVDNIIWWGNDRLHMLEEYLSNFG